MTSQRRTFTPEFKLQLVKLYEKLSKGKVKILIRERR